MAARGSNQHHATDPARGGGTTRLVTPLTASARLRPRGAAFQFGGRGTAGRTDRRSATACQQRRMGQDRHLLSSGTTRPSRPRARPSSQRHRRTHRWSRRRLALPDQHAQSDIVSFGALGILDRAFADLNACDPRTATASATSAPARFADSTSRCANVDSADWSNRSEVLRESSEAVDGEEFTTKSLTIVESWATNWESGDVPDPGSRASSARQIAKQFRHSARSQSCEPTCCEWCFQMQGQVRSPNQALRRDGNRPAAVSRMEREHDPGGGDYSGEAGTSTSGPIRGSSGTTARPFCRSASRRTTPCGAASPRSNSSRTRRAPSCPQGHADAHHPRPRLLVVVAARPRRRADVVLVHRDPVAVVRCASVRTARRRCPPDRNGAISSRFRN